MQENECSKCHSVQSIRDMSAGKLKDAYAKDIPSGQQDISGIVIIAV